jgi:co-chaperonin GroES (HSP10)
MKVKVLGDRVLIKKIEEKEEKEGEMSKTDSGIYLMGEDPKKKNDTTQYYIESKVEAAGSECKDVATGDTIIFDKRAGVNIMIEGEVFQMFKESNVIAVKA